MDEREKIIIAAQKMAVIGQAIATIAGAFNEMIAEYKRMEEEEERKGKMGECEQMAFGIKAYDIEYLGNIELCRGGHIGKNKRHIARVIKNVGNTGRGHTKSKKLFLKSHKKV